MTSATQTDPTINADLLPVAVPETEVDEVETGSEKTRRFRLSGKHGLWALAALATVAFVNYGVLGPLTHKIDNNPEAFSELNVPEGSSYAVATASALLDREINQHGWTPNDPFFAPSAVLDNMPNFQTGAVEAVGRFAFEMLDQIARTRGSSRADPDMERASGFLQFPPDIWVIEPSQSFLPQVTTEATYRQGLEALERYNTRLASGQAVFERRADTLSRTLRRISAELGSQTAQLELAQNTGWWIFSTTADDAFYQNKGMLYAYYVILAGLEKDFAQVIRERNLEAIWAQTLEGLKQGAELQPMIVLNADRENSIFANHLALQGFYLKRVILQLEETVSVLNI